MSAKKIQSWNWFYSIKNRTLILLSSLSILSLMLFLSIRYTDRKVSENAIAYRVSQHNEVLAQQFANLIKGVYRNDDNSKKKLQSVITKYDYNLNILKTGGDITYAGHQLTVPATEGVQLSKLNDLRQLWDTYRDNLYTITNQQEYVTLIDSTLNEKDKITFSVKKVKNQTRMESFDYLSGNSANLSSVNHILSTYYFDKLFVSKRRRSVQLALFFLIFVMLFVIGYYNLIKSFSQPVDKVISVLKQLASGNLEAKLNIKTQNEVGMIAQNVNILADDLQKASNFAHAIGNYDFEMDFKKKNDKDSLSIALLSMRDNLKKVDEESNRRRWTNEGVTLFNDILRTNFDEFDEFAYQIVYNLVQYLGINQGAFYSITEDIDKDIEVLYLNAAFAYDRRRFENKTFALDEGLLAQSIIEKDVIYLTEIPKDYIEITSGLGDAPPSTILIIPLMTEDEVFGAIELASFSELQPFEMEFAQRIADMVASTIASVRVNERTKKLLDEANNAAEQMKSQEIIMKQNVEELVAIQEALEMRDKEKELALSELKSKHVSQLEDVKTIERNLRQQKNDLQVNLDDANEKIFQYEKQMDNFKAAIKQLKSKQTDLNQTIQKRENTIKNLQSTLKDLKEQINTLQSEVPSIDSEMTEDTDKKIDLKKQDNKEKPKDPK